MKNYFKYFVLVGFLIGFLYSIGLMIFTFYQSPGIPGVYEIATLLFMSLALGILHSFYG
jgi:VanZ family protein